VLAIGDAAKQTRISLGRIEQALQLADAEMTHVVRTRIFITHAGDAVSVLVLRLSTH
jgi:enamine deaminase RidA (YjgF/YER057c/UK114 family)